MNTFAGQWIDQDGATITVEQERNFATLKYSNGRGPFEGFQINLATPVINVDFSDGPQWTAGEQVGLQHSDGKTITWSNGTVWRLLDM